MADRMTELLNAVSIARTQRQIIEDLDHPAHGTAKGYEVGCRCYRCLQWKGEPKKMKKLLHKIYPSYDFNFPLNNRAKKTTLHEQHKKVAEEFKEIGFELYKNSKERIDTDIDTDRVLQETLDLIHAAEGILRKFSWYEIQGAYKTVLDNNNAKGDYDD